MFYLYFMVLIFPSQASQNARTSVSMSETSRREVFGAIGAAIIAAPTAASAVAGDSPKFSVFGIVGEKTSMSEGAAYGSDQKSTLYSPYSVYGTGEGKLYDASNPEFDARQKAVIAESKVRLTKIPAYIEKKQWFNVRDELTRYMYGTRESVRYFAKTSETKKAAQTFFVAIEKLSGSATLKKQDEARAAIEESIAALDAFSALI
uniref:Uncharacterized protein n=1 Tax=Corethron hystrix TaxID=216773 RepID=A0A7S1FQC7_9STRA|mmetsp:Transcript_22806/g.52272  ORF Transcript_22806/g.52272 Transcript_22806/m.52272 type:complete len:205 (+) Transcript_22806:429-1043(+)